ncbi:MAG: MarR family transcriptional regulator [Eubacteriales bacterium]
MKHLENIDDAHFLFGSIPILANRMDTLMDRSLCKYGVTAKQWLLSIMLFSLFDTPPTIKEAAREMGSSHQNVKQVALKLQEKGLVQLEKDKKDARATRLRLTEESGAFWEQSNTEGMAFMEAFYRGIDPADLQRARVVIEKLMENLNTIEKDFKEDDTE